LHWLGRGPLPNDDEHQTLRKNTPSIGVAWVGAV
jgi:hypothetical protein